MGLPPNGLSVLSRNTSLLANLSMSSSCKSGPTSAVVALVLMIAYERHDPEVMLELPELAIRRRYRRPAVVTTRVIGNGLRALSETVDEVRRLVEIQSGRVR